MLLFTPKIAKFGYIHLSFIADIFSLTGWPRTRENRENDEKKFPVWKNQGI